MITPEDRSADLTAALSLFQSIPNDVLAQGDAATSEWVNDYVAIQGSKFDFFKASICAGTIAGVIAGFAFGAAKILKIRSLIESLGGVAATVRKIADAGFSAERLKQAGGALAGLAAELIGIGSIRSACFNN